MGRAPPPTKWLRDACAVLGLVDRVAAAAAAYFRRAGPAFHDAPARSSSIGSSSHATMKTSSSSNSLREEAAAACLFLAAKVCEEPRRLRDVLNAVHLAAHGDIIRDAHDYWSRKSCLVAKEQLLLRELGYDTSFEDRQVLLLNSLRLLRAPRALYELAVALLNDFCGRSDQRPARIVVTAAIGLGAQLLELPLPTGWSQILEVDLAAPAFVATCHAMLDVYDDPGSFTPTPTGGGGTGSVSASAVAESETNAALCSEGAEGQTCGTGGL